MRGFFMRRNFASSICVLTCIVFIASASPPPGYSLVWSDEFNGITLDTNTWSFDTGSSWSPGAEYQIYTGNNLTIENGAAVLWVKHEKHGYYNYTSCQMNTRGKKEFKYGYIEVRLKAPYGNGPWAAFWMMGSDIRVGYWPYSGEIELYEQRTGTAGFSTDPGDSAYKVSCDYASASGGPIYNTQRYNYTDCLCNNYHLYAIEWDSLGIKYYFDDNKFWEYDSINLSNNVASFHQPFYFIANVELDGPVDSTIFPQRMSIDYVRVYQKGTQTVATPPKRTLENMTLPNPSEAQLKVYNLQGRLIADNTDRVRNLKPGENVM